MVQTIWIVRHGNRLDFVRPEWFDTAERRYDPPLSQDGLIQARQLAGRLQEEPIRHIFSSPFLRAIQTANPVAEALNLPIKLEAGLGEWLNPDWMAELPEFHPPAILKETYPRIDWNYTSPCLPQYPESQEALSRRTAETARRLAAEFPEPMLLVGHRVSVVGAVLELVEGSPEIQAGLCCLFKLVRSRERWELELNGDSSFL